MWGLRYPHLMLKRDGFQHHANSICLFIFLAWIFLLLYQLLQFFTPSSTAILHDKILFFDKLRARVTSISTSLNLFFYFIWCINFWFRFLYRGYYKTTFFFIIIYANSKHFYFDHIFFVCTRVHYKTLSFTNNHLLMKDCRKNSISIFF